jgi:hypothetical protein
MNTRNVRYLWALPVAAILALAALAPTAEGDASREGTGLAVSMTDFRGVVQERAGYAFTLDHYVDRQRATARELAWWQGMAGELAGREAPNQVVAAYWGAHQERLGYRTAYGALADRREGMRQELLGHQVALAHAMTRSARP